MDTFVNNSLTNGKPNVVISKSVNEMTSLIFEEFSTCIKNSKSSNVTVGLSGGSMVGIMSAVIEKLDETSKNKLILFSVDERLVPLNDENSNTGSYLKALGSDFKKRFVIIDEITDANKAAKEFEEKLKGLDVEKDAVGLPRFDFLFLGMGPDGHTCSLFPNHELLNYCGPSWILPIENSPKPPARRVTIPLGLCNSAKNTIFIVTGENKADVVKEIIVDGSETYPAARVKASQWFLDQAAGKCLTTEV